MDYGYYNSDINNKLLHDLNENIKLLTKNIVELKKAIDINTESDNTSQPEPKVVAKPTHKTGLSIAIVGVRGRGDKHSAAFAKLKNCHISYICDVDSKVGKAAVGAFNKVHGYKPKFVQDFRDMLKDKSVDCVAICTPNHWHALATVLCLQAGKHVYIEKPITHSFNEREAILAAAAKYGKIIQAGTQLRSNTSLKAAGEYIRSGRLGKVSLVHCISHKHRPPVSLSNESKIPATVDYDIWCGPAEKSESTRSKFHYHWHWLWQFGNGALGNNGIHRIDAARIVLDLKGFGDLTISAGGRYGPKDSGETPNNMLSLAKFGETWILQDILGLKPKTFKGSDNAVVFYGSEGTIVYKSGYAALVDEDFNEIGRFEGKQLNHYYNFLQSIRKKDQNFARGEIEEAIISSDLCHFGNISYRVGQPSSFDAVAAKFQELKVPPMVLDRLEALRENLRENDLKEEIILGDLLTLTQDAKAPILNNPAASELLKFNSREGFNLPDPSDV